MAASAGLMTQADYAAHRGVSKQAISKLVKRGIIPLIDSKIDPQVADMKISSQLNPARSKALASPALQGAALPKGASAAPTSPLGADSKLVDINTYAGAKAIREKFEALRAEAEYLKSAGLLVDLAGVKRAAMLAGRATRDAVMPVGVRLAGQLADMSDAKEIAALLERELRKALQDAAKLMQTSVSADSTPAAD